jgi:hypothetical protein
MLPRPVMLNLVLLLKLARIEMRLKNKDEFAAPERCRQTAENSGAQAAGRLLKLLHQDHTSLVRGRAARASAEMGRAKSYGVAD